MHHLLKTVTPTIPAVVPVSRAAFLLTLKEAREYSEKIMQATSPVHEVAAGTTEADGFYLDYNGRYGFIVKENGELISLFSMLRRSGDALLQQAEAHGARTLDCFDGYLVDFYTRNGWTEFYRTPNWTEGHPAVVFMHKIQGGDLCTILGVDVPTVAVKALCAELSAHPRVFSTLAGGRVQVRPSV